jgi:hypothetical protein
LSQIHKITQAEETLKAENEALTKQVRVPASVSSASADDVTIDLCTVCAYHLCDSQAELLTKQLSGVHDEAETVIRLRDELAKSQERLQVLSSASEFNAETASLMEAMQGQFSPSLPLLLPLLSLSVAW